MHAHRSVLIEISMEIGMLNFGLGLLVTALMKETYFRTIYSNSERSEQFLVTECFFNILLEVSHI